METDKCTVSIFFIVDYCVKALFFIVRNQKVHYLWVRYLKILFKR